MMVQERLGVPGVNPAEIKMSIPYLRGTNCGEEDCGIFPLSQTSQYGWGIIIEWSDKYGFIINIYNFSVWISSNRYSLAINFSPVTNYR